MRTAACLLAAAAVTVTVAAAPRAHAGVKLGDRAPELSNVKTAEGKPLRLADHRGKIVVMTFGASWCAPCKKELPALQKIAGPMRKRTHDVVFIAINTNEELDEGRAFMKGLG